MRVLLNVCGGIAAYKAAELVRLLQTAGADVQVAMTRSAQKFVTPLTFAALTGKQVHTSLWSGAKAGESGSQDYEIEHITAVQSIDAFVVAPATANILAKFAHGLADDFVSTAYLANTAPAIIAPAMNIHMWQHPATQANVATLKGRGAQVIAPDAGYLACGMVGAGRLADAGAIAEAVLSVNAVRNEFASETVLITAGGTREPIDPVRFLGNRSSGRMGYALAEAALARGARVVLITAASLQPPADCEVAHVTTAEEMRNAVLAHLPKATIVIKAAAVADYTPVQMADSKLKRTGPLMLELLPTADIAAEVVKKRRDGTLVIAFAAETEDLEANARAKLLRKGVDAIVANNVSAEATGFETDRNAGLFITTEKTVTLAESSKRAMAERILDEVAVLRKTHTAAVSVHA